MAVAFPDVIGEYIDAPERFETSGIQYTAYFEPAEIAPEQVAYLFVLLQNVLNVPLTVEIKIGLPQAGGLLRAGQPILKVGEPILQVKLAAAEAGLITIPVTTEQVKEGEHPLTLEFRVMSDSKGGQRIRPVNSQSKLDSDLIDSPVGLNLVSTLGATFTSKVVKKATFMLKVEGKPQPPERAPQLKYSYQSVWTEKNAEFFNQAIQELNARQVQLKKALTMEALYTTLYAESTFRFADVRLPLRIGEAITLGKILTYSGQYFLSNPHLYFGLLVPMWERAFELGADTTHTLEVIRSVGYHHLLKLSAALSFGLIAQVVKQHYWSLPERQAVTSFIADNIETGQAMDAEFLYLPLLIGGAHISGKFRLPGEDVSHSLVLLKKAREARRDLFLDEDMSQADQVCNHILRQALQSV